MDNKITIVINADGTAAIEGMEKVTAGMKKMESDQKGITKNLKAAWVEIAAGVYLVQQALQVAEKAYNATIGKAIELGDTLNKASVATGISAEKLSVLRFAAEQNETSFENLMTSLKFFQKAMAGVNDDGADTTQILKQLGVTSKDLYTAYLQAADGLGKYEQNAIKTANVLKIFGKNGMDTVGVLNLQSKGINEAGTELEQMHGIMSGENARKFDEFNDRLNKMKFYFEAISIEVAGPVINGLNKFIELLDEITQTPDQMMDKLKKEGDIRSIMGGMSSSYSSRLSDKPKPSMAPAGAKEPKYRSDGSSLEDGGLDYWANFYSEKAKLQEDYEKKSREMSLETLLANEEQDRQNIIFKQRMNEIELEDARRTAQQKIQMVTFGMEAAASILQTIASNMDVRNKEDFEKQQIVQFNIAGINTAAGITRAFSEYSWPYSFIVAAMVGAAGFAQQVAIMSRKYNVAGAPMGFFGGGGSTAQEPTTVAPPKKNTQSITVHVYGNIVDHDQFARELVPAIRKAQEDGV